MFVLLVLIVLQWYKIFTKPDDAKVRENIKKTILYIVIWVLVIGAAYVISNVLVIDRLAIE
jgi:Na+-driven multidrug efflux pump